MLVFIFFYGGRTAKCQDVKDLYYAQPQNSGLYMGFVYLNKESFIIAGLQNLYLFNEQKLIVDTLNFGNGGFSDNLYWMYADLKRKTINVATLNTGMKVQIENDGFKVLDKYDVGGNIKIGKVKFDLVIPLNDQYIGRDKKHKNHYILNRENGEWSIKSNIIDNWPEIGSVFRGSEIISFNRVSVYNNYCYFYDKRYGKLIIYDLESASPQINSMPEIVPEEFIEFYLDPHNGKTYLFRYNSDNKGILYDYDWKTNTYSEKLKTNQLIRGVQNDCYYFSGIFDGTYGHYLKPIKGQNEEVLLINEN